MNKFIIAGRMTSGVRYFSNTNGSQTASFTVAVPRNYKKKGAAQAETDFITCTQYVSAENVKNNAYGPLPYMTKGREVVVAGAIRSYKTTKNGDVNYGINLVAEEITLMGSNKQNAQNAAAAAGNIPAPTAPVEAVVAAEGVAIPEGIAAVGAELTDTEAVATVDVDAYDFV